MNWQKVQFVAIGMPLSFVVALLCAFHSTPTPGLVAMGLLPRLPSQGCCDLRRQGFMVLVDTLSWFVVLTAGYALVRARWKLLRSVRLPLSIVSALAGDGIAFQHSLPTPGLSIWRAVHSPQYSGYDPLTLGLSLLIDIFSWLALFFATSWFVTKLRTRRKNKAIQPEE